MRSLLKVLWILAAVAVLGMVYQGMPARAVPARAVRKSDWLTMVLALPAVENQFLINLGAGRISFAGGEEGLGNVDRTAFAMRVALFGGLAVEPNRADFLEMNATFPDSIHKVNGFATPANIESMLVAAGAPKNPRLFKIDIDSYDLPVVRRVLEAGYRPVSIFVEVNEKVPPPVVFEVGFNPDVAWTYTGIGHCFGASISAWDRLLSGYGYALISQEWNDALFVRREFLPMVHWIFGVDPAESVAAAYRAGYADRPDRKEQFFWNADVEAWQGKHADTLKLQQDIRAFMTDAKENPHCANYSPLEVSLSMTK